MVGAKGNRDRIMIMAEKKGLVCGIRLIGKLSKIEKHSGGKR